jgi:Flp pilus assembly protein TadG
VAHSRRRRTERGQAIVEVAIILPFLAMLVLGGLDLGRAYYYTTALTGAAGFGARVGNNHLLPSTANIQNAVIAAAPELNLNSTNITVTYTCSGCFGASGSFAADPQAPPTVTVTVTWQYKPLTPLIGKLFPGGVATLVGTAEGPVS